MSKGTVVPIKGRKTGFDTEPVSEATARLREEASPHEVRSAIAGMTPAMLRCRRLRQHKWEPSEVDEGRGYIIQIVVCERCGGWKEIEYNKRGRVTRRGTIKYAEGYLFIGLGRVGDKGQDVINLASLRADSDMIRAKGRVDGGRTARQA